MKKYSSLCIALSLLAISNLCFGMLPTGNRPGDGADKQFLAYDNNIESKVCLHVPSLRFLTARNCAETLDTSHIPVRNIKEYVETIKNVIKYEKLTNRDEDPSLYDEKIDCPEEVFYKLNKTLENNTLLASSFVVFSKAKTRKQPETMRMLIEHNCPFAPEYENLESIRQDIPDNPTKAFENIQRQEISPEEAVKKAACLEHPKTITAIIANYPISNHAKKEAFHVAVNNNSLQSCQVLFDCIEQGFDLDQPLYYPENNDYFLTGAVIYNCPKTVSFLLKHGADAHIFKDGALKDASKNGYFEIVKILLEHGADIHALDAHQLEIIGLWDQHNFKNIAATLRELLKNGADITILSKNVQDRYRKLLAYYPEQPNEHSASSSQQLSQ